MSDTRDDLVRGFFQSTRTLIDLFEPDDPLALYHPSRVQSALEELKSIVPGSLAHATSGTLRHTALLSDLHSWGIETFLTATLDEVIAVRLAAPQARIVMTGLFKNRLDIIEAYHRHGVRLFSASHESEVLKILEVTGPDCGIILQVSSSEKLSAKHPTPLMSEREAVPLISKLARLGLRIGIGVASKHPRDGASIESLTTNIETLGRIVDHSQVRPHYILVDPLFCGGGVRGAADALRSSLSHVRLRPDTQIVVRTNNCPARDAFTMLYRIIGRKERMLFIQEDPRRLEQNAFGDTAIAYGFRKKLRGRRRRFQLMSGFCIDAANDLYLPEDIEQDDWIELRLNGPWQANRLPNLDKAPVVIGFQ